MRLAPEPPALLSRLEPERARPIVDDLRRAGLAVLSVPSNCPTDKDRLVARTVIFDQGSVTFTSRLGESMSIAWADVLAVLRGLRSARSEVTRTERRTKLSLTRGVLTGGLVLRRTSVNTVRSTEEATEQVILVYTRQGGAALLSERELDFSCLGRSMQPSSTGNMAELARRLRECAKAAFYDERLLRLGRRPLPFTSLVEHQPSAVAGTARCVETTRVLDTLAEVMRRALSEGLLP